MFSKGQGIGGTFLVRPPGKLARRGPKRLFLSTKRSMRDTGKNALPTPQEVGDTEDKEGEMSITKIEWADKVWNPLTGCSPISEGCRNCYAKRMAIRLAGRYGYGSKTPFKITEHPDHFKDPCRWKKPSRIFVCSMGDLFHEDVSYTTVGKILWYATREESQKHTFLILTKRPQRMAKYFNHYYSIKGWGEATNKPERNVWLGVSVEDQATADERIPILLQIPAAHRWVSIEPMLGPVDFRNLPVPNSDGFCFDALSDKDDEHFFNSHSKLDWLVLGGETGPKARPMKVEWAESVLHQCQAASVPFYFKNWGTANGKRKTHILDGKEWRQLP